MKNIAKHSIKCNKRDKVELVDVCYRVYNNTDNGIVFLHEFATKFDALNYISCNILEGCDIRIYKVTLERVLS